MKKMHQMQRVALGFRTLVRSSVLAPIAYRIGRNRQIAFSMRRNDKDGHLEGQNQSQKQTTDIQSQDQDDLPINSRAGDQDLTKAALSMSSKPVSGKVVDSSLKKVLNEFENDHNDQKTQLSTPWYLNTNEFPAEDDIIGEINDYHSTNTPFNEDSIEIPPIPANAPACLSECVDLLARTLLMSNIQIYDLRKIPLDIGWSDSSIIVVASCNSERQLKSGGERFREFLKQDCKVLPLIQGLDRHNKSKFRRKLSKYRSTNESLAAARLNQWVLIEPQSQGRKVLSKTKFHLFTTESREYFNVDDILRKKLGMPTTNNIAKNTANVQKCNVTETSTVDCELNKALNVNQGLNLENNRRSFIGNNPLLRQSSPVNSLKQPQSLNRRSYSTSTSHETNVYTRFRPNLRSLSDIAAIWDFISVRSDFESLNSIFAKSTNSISLVPVHHKFQNEAIGDLIRFLKENEFPRTTSYTSSEVDEVVESIRDQLQGHPIGESKSFTDVAQQILDSKCERVAKTAFVNGQYHDLMRLHKANKHLFPSYYVFACIIRNIQLMQTSNHSFQDLEEARSYFDEFFSEIVPSGKDWIRRSQLYSLLCYLAPDRYNLDMLIEVIDECEMSTKKTAIEMYFVAMDAISVLDFSFLSETEREELQNCGIPNDNKYSWIVQARIQEISRLLTRIQARYNEKETDASTRPLTAFYRSCFVDLLSCRQIMACAVGSKDGFKRAPLDHLAFLIEDLMAQSQISWTPEMFLTSMSGLASSYHFRALFSRFMKFSSANFATNSDLWMLLFKLVYSTKSMNGALMALDSWYPEMTHYINPSDYTDGLRDSLRGILSMVDPNIVIKAYRSIWRDINEYGDNRTVQEEASENTDDTEPQKDLINVQVQLLAELRQRLAFQF